MLGFQLPLAETSCEPSESGLTGLRSPTYSMNKNSFKIPSMTDPKRDPCLPVALLEAFV